MKKNINILRRHILVTGGTGMIGFYLCNYLSNLDLKVTVISRNITNYIAIKKVNYIHTDILDYKKLTLLPNDIDTVIHLAGHVHNPKDKLEKIKNVNINGTKNIIKFSQNRKIRLIHISTVNVQHFYDGKLFSSYAKTKALSEKEVLEATKTGLDALVIRPGTVFGTEKNYSGTLIEKIIRSKLPILPAPERIISPIWAQDLVEAIINSINLGYKGKIYVVANKPMSTGQFVNIIRTRLGSKKMMIPISRKKIVFFVRLLNKMNLFGSLISSVSYENIKIDSSFDGSFSSKELNFTYTNLDEIF